jgi:hypothetical protein
MLTRRVIVVMDQITRVVVGSPCADMIAGVRCVQRFEFMIVETGVCVRVF